MVRILIAVDGSELSMRAVRHAVWLKNELRSAVEALLVNVQPTLPMRELLLAGGPSDVHQREEPLKARGAELLAAAKAVLESAAIQTRLFVEIGEPAPVIAGLAKTYHCDFIVAGKSGGDGPAGHHLGATANKLLHLAEVPVVIVP